MKEGDSIISLDNRLLQCAKLVREGARVVDVGTDHAYLAIYLVKSGKVKCVVATDLREGPLNNALDGIKKYGCEKSIKIKLTDGLDGVNANEADDIVIAGMGGELIANIIVRAAWLKNSAKHLVLQPMTMAEHLRRFLFNEGFKILEETAVTSGNKAYTVMSAVFCENTFEVSDLYPYIGKLDKNLDEAAIIYIKKEIKDLKNKAQGHRCQAEFEKCKKIECIIHKLEALIRGE